MKLTDIHAILVSTGYPVAFSHFETSSPLPYLVYLTPYSVNTYTDDTVAVSATHYQVELYTDKKDVTAERKVEDALAVFCWEKSQDYLSEEKMFRTIYEYEEFD
jgi:hypothetical protein